MPKDDITDEFYMGKWEWGTVIGTIIAICIVMCAYVVYTKGTLS